MLLARNESGDATTVHPRNAAQTKGGGSKDSTGVPHRYHRVGFAFVHQFHRADNRAILFLAHGGGRFVLHRKHFAGMDHADAVVAKAPVWQRGMDLRPVAYQIQGGDTVIRLQGPLRPFDDDSAAVVASHDIHCNAHRDGLDAEAHVPAPWGPKVKPRPSP